MDFVSACSAVIAVLALVVAWVQLTRIREERQRNFFLTQLVDIADALQEFGGVAPDKVQVRVRAFPAEMRRKYLPDTWAWVSEKDRSPSSLFATFEREGAPGDDWGNWVRARVRTEIYAAIAELLAARAHSRRPS